MRLLFDLSPLHDHLSGIERYTLNIAKNVMLQHPEDDYILLFKEEIHPDFEALCQRDNVKSVVLPACNKLLFQQVRVLRALRKEKADYYIFLSFLSPVLFRRKGIVNAIHDLSCWDCPETMPRKMVAYFRLTNWFAVRRSAILDTVSVFSQARICERFHLSQSQVQVCYNGVSDVFLSDAPADIPAVREKYKLPEKYLLSLSTLEPRKNLQLLIRAYAHLLNEGEALPDLVLAGRAGWKLEDVFDGMTEAVRGRIHTTGFIDDEDLPALYRGAELFVFPSIYEGFGIPVIEAMSQRVPVLTSDAASLPEVAGEAGWMFKSRSEDDLKAKLRAFFALSEEERRAIGAKGDFVRQRFSWKSEAEKFHALLAQRLSER